MNKKVMGKMWGPQGGIRMESNQTLFKSDLRDKTNVRVFVKQFG